MEPIAIVGIVASAVTGYLLVAGTVFALLSEPARDEMPREFTAAIWPIMFAIWFVVTPIALIPSRLIGWRRNRTNLPRAEVR